VTYVHLAAYVVAAAVGVAPFGDGSAASTASGSGSRLNPW